MSGAPAAVAGGPSAGPAVLGSCFHCGEELPARPAEATLEGHIEQFCCAGCASAALWITGAGLKDYYQLRTARADRVGTEPTDLDAWDREDVIAQHVRNVPGGREIVLATDGMHCAACAWLIDRALSREPGVGEVSANAVTGRIRLVWNPARNRLSAILSRLQSLGYRPYLAGSLDTERARRREHYRWIMRLGLAGIVAVQTMMFTEALYLDTSGQMPLATRDFFRWLAFLLATPVVFYAGYPFLAGAWRELSHRTAGMNTLVAGSVLLAWAGSTVETVRGGPQVWFDAAVMFVFLLLAARMFEARARQLAVARVEALARASPVLARREHATGTETVPLAQLRTGDVVRVVTGEHVPADGILLDAGAALNESLLTGESRPVPRAAGDSVLAGSISTDQPLRLRVTATGSATRMAALARLTQRAQEHKPRLARQAERIASWFVLGIAVLAVSVYLYWRGVAPERAFDVTLALLVVSCPCALSLAVPAALAAAYSRLSGLGVLVLRADALQQLASIDTVVFDKTGTLGDGNWRISRTDTFGAIDQESALRSAAALEHDSMHPLASAFRRYDGAVVAHGVTRVAGLGLEGVVGGRRLRLGVAGFAAGCDDDGAVWLGDGSAPLARFEISEQPRQEGAATLRQLHRLGLRLQLLSGDAVATVRGFAASLGAAFETIEGRLLPEDKLARIRALQGSGRRVAMVGDGINDAPVLAGANVSLAVSGSAALARQSADLALLQPSLARIPQVIEVARRTRRIVRQNLTWAIGYNLAALPLAVAGLIEPWAAALAMVVSSLTVTLNALRLARPAKP
jgi:Cu2+-exporting ATPase